MPYSYGGFKKEIVAHIAKVAKGLKILDVGPGMAIYSKMLKEHGEYDLDAVEIFEPYVEMYSLKTLYKNVFVDSILNFDCSPYDYLIIGDVVEHLGIEEAQHFLKKYNDKKIMIAVPYRLNQGIVNGNKWEEHIQNDLTHDIFLQRYPQFHRIIGNRKYGHYINYEGGL